VNGAPSALFSLGVVNEESAFCSLGISCQEFQTQDSSCRSRRASLTSRPPVLRLPAVERLRAYTVLPAQFRRRLPASDSFSMPTICSSVNRLFFISALLLQGFHPPK
jgi:hypothetical protein